MTEPMAEAAAQVRAFSLFELAAVVLAVGYLVLAIRQNIWCWLCAGLSTAGYIWLFIDAKLYMESLLNLFYLAMAMYGWHAWRSTGGTERQPPVMRWPLAVHAGAILVVGGLSAVTGALLERYSDAAYPYIDSLTTYAAIWTTFLVARKVLENWWYWLVIDAASVLIYWSRELPLTAMLFVLYLALIPVGLVHWTKSYREQTA